MTNSTNQCSKTISICNLCKWSHSCFKNCLRHVHHIKSMKIIVIR